METLPYLKTAPIELIFIIGPPRSGTTLLYQLITEAFEVGFITNSHARFYGGLSLYEKWCRPLRNRQDSNYQSMHGRTLGPTGANECGAYWYQFFPRDPVYVTLEDFSPRQRERLQASVSRICEAFRKPVVIKNVMNSARLQVLHHLFPEAVFLYCIRDVLDNAHSILAAKEKALGRLDRHWSLQPKGLEAYESATPEIQAVQQVRLCHEMVQTDIAPHDANRVRQISYESLCDDPRGTIDQLFSFLRCSFPDLTRRTSCQVPTAFERSSGIRIDPGLYARLESTVEDLHGV